MPTSDELRMLQALPLDLKVRRTEQRIREWVDYWGKDHVCVSFSGGKDSTVLLHIVRKMYGDEIPAVFVNTGLEYPEVQRHVRSFPNVIVLRPEMNYREVLTRYGYPVISKEVSNCIEATRNWCSKNLHVEREREWNGRSDKSSADVWRRKIFGGGYIPYHVRQVFGLDEFGRSHRVPDELGVGPYCRRERRCGVMGGEDVRSGESGAKADKGEYP